MANEFKIRKGYKALASSEITGSLKIKGSTTIDSGGDTNPLTLQGSSHKYLDITTTSNRQVGIRMTDDSVTYTMGLHGGEEAFKISKNSEFGVNDYFTITEDGNVGIGTIYPSTRLGISGSADINGNLTVNGGTIILDPDSAGTVLFWRESDSTTIAGQLRGYANRGDIYLYKDGIKLVELTPLTDSFIPALHIGGTTGATDGVLQTTGDINIDGNAIFTGDVGIGTTSPDRALHVKGSAIVSTKLEGTNAGHLVDFFNTNASPKYNGIRFYNGTTSKMSITHITDGTTRGYVQISNTWASGSEILVVDGRTSRVGIGTNSPTAELQVAGDVVVDGTITAQEFHTEFVSASILYDSGSTKFGDTSDDIHSFSGSLRVTGSGDHYFIGGGGVGIGTTSTSRMLHVIGNTEIEGNLFVEAPNNNIRLLDTNDATVNFSVGVNGLFQIRDVAAATTPFQIEKAAPDNSLRIEANGNIGIGTNNPTAELQVAGDVVVDGTITAQEFHTEFVSASILYESGSTQFGNSADDNHIFTGSIKVTNLQTNGETLFEAERHPNFYFKIQDYAQVDHRVNGNVNAFTVRNTATTQAAPVLTLGHGTVGSPHISTYSTNEDLTIDPNGTGKTRIKGSTDVTGSLDVTGNNTALSVRNINPNSSDTGIEIRGARNSGIGSPTSYIHFNNNDDDSGGLHNLARIYGAMASTGGNDGTLTLQSWNGSAYVDGIRINAAGNVGIGSTGPVEKLDVGGSIKVTGTIKVGSNIEGTEAVTLIKDIITDQSYEHKAFYNPEVLNAFAGADHWATITLTNAKESDRTTTMTSLGERPFRVGGLTAQPYFDVSETEIVIEIDHTADPLKYHAIVGMQFTAQQWTPNRVKIEAYNGTTWTTGLDTTNHSETTVAVKFSLGSAGVKKTKFTLGNPRSAAGYVRISKIFGYDFKGVSFLDDVKSGTYFIDRYDDSGHYSNIYPATNSVYSLGTSNLRYANIYADTGSFDGNVGIGTTSPAEKLHVVGNISGSDVDINDWGSVSASLAAIQTAGGVNGTGSASKVAIWSDSDTLTSDTNLHWDSSNDRLGIGTTSPSAMLNIVDSNPKIVLEDSDNTGTFGQIRQQAGNLQFLSNNNTSNGTIQFKLYDGTNTTDAMYIASSGNVGIGTTNPIYPFQVVGNAYVNSGTLFIDSGQRLKWGNSKQFIEGTNDTSLEFGTGGTTKMYLDNSGNLGIGTTNPGYELEVDGDIRATSEVFWGNNNSSPVGRLYAGAQTGVMLNTENDGAIVVAGGNGTSSGGNIAFFGGTHSSQANEVRFRSGGTNTMLIDSSGNVGIGTTSPSEKLEVAGNIVVSNNGSLKASGSGYLLAGNDDGGLIRIGGDSNDSYIQPHFNNLVIQTSRAEDDIEFKVGENAATSSMFIDSANGNVGIGTTSPSGLLHVSSGTSGDALVIIESDTDNNNENDNPTLKFIQDGGNTTATVGLNGDASKAFTNSLANAAYFGHNEAASVQFYTNAIARLTIEPGGNVGIGTTSPLHPLHVNGVISGSDTYINGWNSVSASLSTLTTDLDVLENKNLISSSAQIASDISGSITSFSGSIAGRVETNESSISSLNGATGSYLLNTTDTLTGNLTVTGTLTAQEFHTEFVSASILFDSGSTKFGDSSDDVHNFTGSVNVKSLSTGAKLTIEDDTAKTELQHNLHAFRIKVDPNAADSNSNFRVEIDGSEKLRIQSDGKVGIGTDAPIVKLDVDGSVNQRVLSFASSDDLNNLDSTRFFISHTATTNVPAAISAFGMGWTIAYNTDNTVQFLTNRNSSDPVYFRKQSNSTYSSWIRLRDENQITDTDISNWDTGYLNWSGESYTDLNTASGSNQFIKAHTSATNFPDDAYFSQTSPAFFSGITALHSVGNGWQLMSNRNIADTLGYRKVSNGNWGAWKYLWSTDHFTTSSVNNWNTAYSWGDHAGLYVDGSGTANYITKWSDADTITDSLIYDNGTDVGIGTTSPTDLLHVDGARSNFNGIKIGENGNKIQFAAVDGNVGVGNNNWFILSEGATEVLRAGGSSGRLGIGKTSPSEKLNVSGSVRVDDGELYVTSDGSSRKPVRLHQTTDKGAITLQRDGVDNVNISSDQPTQGHTYFSGSGVNVGIGKTSPTYKLDVSGGSRSGGVITYSKNYNSLNTTGNAVAGLTAATNGASAGFTFTCFGHTGGYQKIVYSCYNDTGTWNTKKVIDEGTNDFDIEASANATTITFTFKSTSGTKSYAPRVTVEAAGNSINSTYA